jgi:hypothetical protein
MRRGAIRQISWAPTSFREAAVKDTVELGAVIVDEVTAAGPAPSARASMAKILLRIAAEVEGALMVQYLYAAYSILPGASVSVPSPGSTILSDDWYDVVRDIAKQEMGHLITVQNLLISLGGGPHLDRENFPWLNSDLYPFPFHLQSLALETLAKDVTAEAPRSVAPSDLGDYQEAAALANAVAGQVSRVGQIYERLYFLFQDTDAPQAPWSDLVNPFPNWPSWHVPDSLLGLNQDRQAQPNEWRGDDATIPADTAIYVLPAADKASARTAIYSVALQGEGPPSAVGIATHFEKFLRVYREFRTYAAQAARPPFIRNQATDPTTGASTPGSITDPVTLAWAHLANTHYQMLLLDIALAFSTGNSGFVSSTTASRRDFIAWAIGTEMLVAIKKTAEELRDMPLIQSAAPDSVRAGLPFELPQTADLPITVPEQLAQLRGLVSQSTSIRATILQSGSPTAKQKNLLAFLENAETKISQKIGL